MIIDVYSKPMVNHGRPTYVYITLYRIYRFQIHAYHCISIHCLFACGCTCSHCFCRCFFCMGGWLMLTPNSICTFHGSVLSLWGGWSIVRPKCLSLCKSRQGQGPQGFSLCAAFLSSLCSRIQQCQVAKWFQKRSIDQSHTQSLTVFWRPFH